MKKVEIRRSGFLEFSKSGRSGSGRDQEIKPPRKSYIQKSYQKNINESRIWDEVIT